MTEVSVPNCPSKMHPTGPVALATDKPPAPPHRLRWPSVASAAALVAALAVPASQAWAVALGRVTVQSQLGEPLRAEIDLPQLSAQDAATLQASVAAPERFQALNLSFNPALADLRFQLVTLPDGRSVLRLSSTAAINEPFLDLLVQANWANGQLLRGYTLLFDPPNLRPAPAPQPPVAAVPLPAPPPAAPAAAPTAPPAPWVTQVRPAVPLPPAAPAAAAPARPRAQAPAADPIPASITVRRGDTAGRIAQAHLPAGVSLDQMLVALLQANPQAFIGDNVNRLRAGAVLDLPSTEAASATPASEARRIVQAHSRDFNEFRRRLAALAPAQAAPEATRAAAGAVQAEVTDPRPAATAQDRLTLERGALPGAAADQLAQARQQQATQQQITEVERNLQELERLRQAAQAHAAAPVPAPAAPAPADAAPAAAATPEAPAPAAPALEAPALAAAPAPAAPAAPPAPPPTEVAAPGLLQTLTAHPLALPAAGGAAALLLLGLLAARIRSRRQQDQAALADRDDPQSEPASGALADAPTDAPATSMMYSPSQLDAGGDVDAVAEAEVYLAYGREKQAEDILLESIRLHPERLPAHLKLLEIYGQRRDLAAFNAAAQTLHQVSGGTGDAWEQAREAGQLLDPDNPLYQLVPSSTPSGSAPATGAASNADNPAAVAPDFDLGFADSASGPASRSGPATGSDPTSRQAMDAADEELEALLTGTRKPTTPATDLAFDFDFEQAPAAASAPATTVPATQAAPVSAAPALDIDFDLDLDDTPAPATQKPPATPPAPANAATALPSSLQDLSLDLDLDPEPSGADPLETKLSLAQEFDAIGDTDGARSLALEVESEATGALKERARAFLAQLG